MIERGSIESITSAATSFKCKPYGQWLPAGACAKRQAMVRAGVRRGDTGLCRNCADGAKVEAKLGGPVALEPDELPEGTVPKLHLKVVNQEDTRASARPTAPRTSKKQYKSFAHALEDIPRVKLQYGAGDLTGYRCVVCRQWHLAKVVEEQT